MEVLAASLARHGWVLRTGLSPGADQAFYRGALAGGGAVELYLPCPDFEARARSEGSGSGVWALERPTRRAYELAARYYEPFDGPAWEQLAPGAAALLARDVHQVLGAELDSPAASVVCWTPDAGLNGDDPRSGGTGQALRVAHEHRIPVFNLARPEHVRRVSELHRAQ